MIYILGTTGTHGGPAKFKNLFVEFLKSNRHEFRVDSENSNLILSDKISIIISDFYYLINNRKSVRIFIVNGTSRLFVQLFARLLGITVIIRLDGYKHYEIKDLNFRNSLIARVRKYIVNINILLSNRIVFQSSFIRSTYLNSKIGKLVLSKTNLVILNPCELISSLRFKGDSILCVEGSIGGAYSRELLKVLSKFKKIHVVGEVSEEDKIFGINYLGRIDRDQLINLFYSDWFAYVPLEPFPPCPNSMIEAIVYGIPVIASKSGANPEILENSELLFDVPFTWKDDLSNLNLDENLIKSKLEILDNNWDNYSNFSKQISSKFDMNMVLSRYRDFILA